MQILKKERTNAEIAREFGVTRQAVSLWVQQARRNDGRLPAPRKRGRRKQQPLSEVRLDTVESIIRQNNPAQAGLKDHGKYWRVDSVIALILKEFGIRYSRRFTYEHLKEWGLITPDGDWIPHPPKAAAQRRPTFPETDNAGSHHDPFLSPKRGRPSTQDKETDALQIDYQAGIREAQEIMGRSHQPGLPHHGLRSGRHAKQRLAQTGKKKRKARPHKRR